MSIGRAIVFSLYKTTVCNRRQTYTAYKLLLQLCSFNKTFKIQIIFNLYIKINISNTYVIYKNIQFIYKKNKYFEYIC